MQSNSIQIKKLGKPCKGYRILASWRRPRKEWGPTGIDLWIPELAPSMSLMNDYRRRKINREELLNRYHSEIETSPSQDFLKLIALLSRKKNVVLLCDCPNEADCTNKVLAEALRKCKHRGNFVLSPLKSKQEALEAI